MNKVIHYVGLDVHKETIAVSIAPTNSTEVRRYGIIGAGYSYNNDFNGDVGEVRAMCAGEGEEFDGGDGRVRSLRERCFGWRWRGLGRRYAEPPVSPGRNDEDQSHQHEGDDHPHFARQLLFFGGGWRTHSARDGTGSDPPAWKG